MRVSLGQVVGGYDVSAGMFGDAPAGNLDALNQLPIIPASQYTGPSSDNAIIAAAAGAIPVAGGGTVAAPASSSTYLYLGLAAVGVLVFFGMRKR